MKKRFVLIELCRIEMCVGGCQAGGQVVLIELCRIEIAEEGIGRAGTGGFNRTL